MELGRMEVSQHDVLVLWELPAKQSMFLWMLERMQYTQPSHQPPNKTSPLTPIPSSPKYLFDLQTF